MYSDHFTGANIVLGEVMQSDSTIEVNVKPNSECCLVRASVVLTYIVCMVSNYEVRFEQRARNRVVGKQRS